MLLMRCNFGLLGNINVTVKFCNASDVMHEQRLAPHDDYHLSSIVIITLLQPNTPSSQGEPSR